MTNIKLYDSLIWEEALAECQYAKHNYEAY